MKLVNSPPGRDPASLLKQGGVPMVSVRVAEAARSAGRSRPAAVRVAGRFAEIAGT